MVDYDAELRLHNERLREACEIGPSDRVLDIGCGFGQTTVKRHVLPSRPRPWRRVLGGDDWKALAIAAGRQALATSPSNTQTLQCVAFPTSPLTSRSVVLERCSSPTRRRLLPTSGGHCVLRRGW